MCKIILVKKLKNQAPLILVIFILIIIFIYFQSQTKIFTNSTVDENTMRQMLNNAHSETSMPERKTNLDSDSQSSRKSIRRMDHDPVGVILHLPKNHNGGLKHAISSNHHVASSKLTSNRMISFHRIVHLDLKGAPPKISYLKKLIPVLQSLGATGLLIEYEDMFPYWNDLQIISANNAYKREELLEFLEVAKNHDMEVIPLIQTFGHMEYILKLKEFAFLREVPNYPQVICPTNNQTFLLLKNVIDQIIELHSGLNWIHIGSDEVYNIGECNKCQKYILKENINKEDLFLRHSVEVAKYIKDSYDVQPIMWDDEFRKIPLQVIMNSNIGNYVEIMVWQYSPGILANIGNDVWEKYGDIFGGLWVASAFKGASLPDSFLTDINERLNNNKEWIDVLDLYKGNIPFKGITLTGWQRFDHFAVLCELLPQAIPSLAVSLSYILKRKADHNALSMIGASLGCDSFLNLDLKYIEFVNHCTFPGSKIYEIAQRIFMLKKDVTTMFEGNHVRGWVTSYNLKYNFASPQFVEQGLQDLSMLIFEYKKLYADAKSALGEIYDKYTVNEWIQQNIDENAQKLGNLFQGRKQLLTQTHWPRRPLELLADKEL